MAQFRRTSILLNAINFSYAPLLSHADENSNGISCLSNLQVSRIRVRVLPDEVIVNLSDDVPWDVTAWIQEFAQADFCIDATQRILSSDEFSWMLT
jgi:hypothetical protein